MFTRADQSIALADSTASHLTQPTREQMAVLSASIELLVVSDEEHGIAMPENFDWLSPQDVGIEQALEHNWTSFETALKAAAGAREPVGELLLMARRITRQQLDFALREQLKTGERLGDMLVAFGWITVCEKEAVLAFQHNQDGIDGPLRLGNLLVAAGIITREQLNDAITRQRSTGKKLGTVLVEAGYAEPGQVMRGLSLQRRLVKAALAALVSLSVLAMAPPANAGDKMGSMAVNVTVLPVIKLDVKQRLAHLNITPADVLRGYVDVPAASSIEIRSNSRSGFTLEFNTMVGLFKAVHVTGLGTQVELGSDGGSVVQRGRGPGLVALQLGYRFILADRVESGSYAWPIALSAQAL